MIFPPVPYTPPMYRNRPNAARVWYTPPGREFATKYAEILQAARGESPDGDALDSGIRELFAGSVVNIEIAGTMHDASLDVPPQFIAQVVAGIAAGGFDPEYPKS